MRWWECLLAVGRRRCVVEGADDRLDVLMRHQQPGHRAGEARNLHATLREHAEQGSLSLPLRQGALCLREAGLARVGRGERDAQEVRLRPLGQVEDELAQRRRRELGRGKHLLHSCVQRLDERDGDEEGERPAGHALRHALLGALQTGGHRVGAMSEGVGADEVRLVGRDAVRQHVDNDDKDFGSARAHGAKQRAVEQPRQWGEIALNQRCEGLGVRHQGADEREHERAQQRSRAAEQASRSVERAGDQRGPDAAILGRSRRWLCSRRSGLDS